MAKGNQIVDIATTMRYASVVPIPKPNASCENNHRCADAVLVRERSADTRDAMVGKEVMGDSRRWRVLLGMVCLELEEVKAGSLQDGGVCLSATCEL